jgi:hypothetical protein
MTNRCNDVGIAEGFDVADSYDSLAGESANGSTDNVLKHAHSDTHLNEIESKKLGGKRPKLRFTASAVNLMDQPRKFPGGYPARFELDKCARCEDIEAVDVVMGDWKRWRPIVAAWEQLAAVFAGEFLHGSERIAFVTNEETMTEALVYRNERLRQVYTYQLCVMVVFALMPFVVAEHA